MRKLYLNELLDDYKYGSDTVKQRRLDKFKKELWNSKCGIEIYSRYYSIRVMKNLLNKREDLIELFNKYKKIEYKVCKSQYKEILQQSIDYIRLHVNNMYTYLFDKNVYIDKEYYALLKVPKDEYFKIIKNKNANDVDINVVMNTIEQALQKAEKIKQESISKKFNLSWNGYQKLINSFIDKIFDNYKSIEEYEKGKEWDIDVEVDGWNEDNFIVGYFCKSLNGYMRNYMRKLKSVDYKLCEVCQDPIFPTSNAIKYCPECARDVKLENDRRIQKERYNSRK